MFGLNEAFLSVLTNIRNWDMENTSVVAPIYRRSGDKSDGVYSPVGNATLTKTVYQFDTVNIPAGVTITAKAPGLILLANSVVISGLLTASGLGANGTPGTTSNVSALAAEDGCGLVGGGGGGGASSGPDYSGGNGGRGRALGGTKGTYSTVPAAAGISDVDAMFPISSLIGFKVGGGGGGAAGSQLFGGNGGNGGGYIIIVTKSLIINTGGAIRADGINGTVGSQPCGGGGGGGGVIVLDTLSYSNSGTISVAGGTGGSAGAVSGGDGGAGCKLIIKRGMR